MKHKLYLLLLCPLYLSACHPHVDNISLTSKYYRNAHMIEVSNSDEFNLLIDAKESFIVYVYLNGCFACLSFNTVIEGFIENEKIAVIKLNADFLNSTILESSVEYTPTVLIINKGSIYQKLDPLSEKEKDAFQNVQSFTSWVYTYVYPVYQPLS